MAVHLVHSKSENLVLKEQRSACRHGMWTKAVATGVTVGQLRVGCANFITRLMRLLRIPETRFRKVNTVHANNDLLGETLCRF